MGVLSNATISDPYIQDGTVDQAGFTAIANHFAVTWHVHKHSVMAKFVYGITMLIDFLVVVINFN